MNLDDNESVVLKIYLIILFPEAFYFPISFGSGILKHRKYITSFFFLNIEVRVAYINADSLIFSASIDSLKKLTTICTRYCAHLT